MSSATAKGHNFLEMTDIRKSFGSVSVLKRVHFHLRQGEVHALMGGNGAGKSTLMKILTGVYQKDAGTVLIDGQPVDLHDTAAAERAGIAMIFQEFSLVPTLTVAQNIWLKREPRISSATAGAAATATVSVRAGAAGAGAAVGRAGTAAEPAEGAGPTASPSA